MDEYLRYSEFLKPSWAPPAWVFGPVWTVLYAVITYTFGTVLYRVARGEWPRSVAVPFLLNIFFNIAFTPLQFWLGNNMLASVDIVLVFITLLWAMGVVWRYARWIVYANIPYAVWVAFATFLQFSITALNR